MRKDERGESMPNFDFSNLFSVSPLRFQQFACAIVSRREGVTFQRFGAGKDGGIDGLFSSEVGKIVIQAKCTEARGRALMNSLKREAKKAEKLECSRYILVVSSKSIEEAEKNEIIVLFPNIRSTNDIVTGVDLNGYLELPQYADIEKSYPELWLCSGNQLEEMLSEAVLKRIKARAAVKFTLMGEASSFFVSTTAFFEAVKILENSQRVIISGAPGAGKTTHAVCIANYYLTIKKYKELYFVESIREIEEILGLKKEEKIIIIFDDFWGHGSFADSRLEFNFERKLRELFEALEYYPNIRLIFTTREFVLRQGFVRFPELERLCELEKINIELKTYSMAQRAEILYRHLDRVQLEYSYVEAIFEKRERILMCEAYSPRSVEYFLKHIHPESFGETEYAKALYEFVRYPEKRYEETFKELSLGAKWICILLLVSEEEIRVDVELKNAFMEVADEMHGLIEKLEYENYLRELEGVFTAIRESFEGELVVDFLNYSVRDFMKSYMEHHIEFFENILVKRAIYFNHLYYLADDMNISEKNQRVIIKRLMDEMDALKFTYVYTMDIGVNYSVNESARAYHVHKVWKMFRLYKKRGSQKIFLFLTDYCNYICECLHQRKATREEMVAAVDVIPEMWKNGFWLEWATFLEDYYQNINWCYDIKRLDYFKDYCEEIYTKFLESHYEDIRERLPGLIQEDIEYLLDEPDGEEEIEYLLMEAKLLFEKYNLPYDRKMEKLLYEIAERPIPRRTKCGYARDEGEMFEYEKEKLHYKELTEKMQKRLLPEIKYLSAKQIKERERCVGKDYRRGYLTHGKFEGDNFEIVMEYLQTLIKVPSREIQFYLGLTEYLLKEHFELDLQILEYIARRLGEDNIFFFSEKTLQKYSLGVDLPRLIERFSEAEIFRKSGKWYHFWNKKHMHCLAIDSILKMSEDEKRVYFQEQFDRGEYEEDCWLYILKEGDREDFYKFLVTPVLGAYLEQFNGMDKLEQEISVIREMEMEWSLMDFAGQKEWVLYSVWSETIQLMNIIGYNNAYEIENTFWDVLFSDLPYSDFCENIDGKVTIRINKMLESKKGIKFLEECGCFEKAAKMLEEMKMFCEKE